MSTLTQTTGDSSRPQEFEEFLSLMHPIERYTRLILFRFHRNHRNEFGFGKLRLFKLVLVTFSIDLVAQFYKIVQYMMESNLGEAQQVGAILSIETLAYIRGVSLYLKMDDIAEILNEFDRIFPRTVEMQAGLKLPAVSRSLARRYKYFYPVTLGAFSCFTVIPLMKYLLFYRDKSIPIADEYHQNPSWMPFEIKQNHRTYPFAYAYEQYVTTSGFMFLMLWERVFTLLMAQLHMHYEFLCAELLKLDARATTLRAPQSKEFHHHLRLLMAYQRNLNRLGRTFSEIFKFSILCSDSICAGSITFHIYLVLNTDDYMAIVLFMSPALVLTWLIYDMSEQGTLLEDVTSNVKQCLYNHNWYEGSLKYRRHVIQWMQYTYLPMRFHGYRQFEVNMVHFQKMMTLTYQLLTFLQSRKH